MDQGGGMGGKQMLMTRTPLRVSFLGGGSDYAEFFNKEKGCVLGTTVDLFVYTAVLKHSKLADSKFKLTYRNNESVNEIASIQHPLVRAVLQYTEWGDSGLHIATLADVPANTGLGSSSAFAVGLLKAIYELQGKSTNNEQVARDAINIERKILAEAGGWQDQIHSSYGGISVIEFESNEFRRSEQKYPPGFDSLLSKRMVLVSAGSRRISSTFARATQEANKSSYGISISREIADIALNASAAIAQSTNPEESFKVLANSMNLSWNLKKRITHEEAEEVGEVINIGLSNGAISAKLCGAGGSGFILFLLDHVSKEEFIRNFDSSRVQGVNVYHKGTEVGFKDWKKDGLYEKSAE
jgi:D-glycero-alpha-D-manno-heptose-7-phosphate kinase